MRATTKKVILFIVEGSSDQAALNPILKKLFQNEQVRFHIVHGDICSDFSTVSNNAINLVNDHIKEEMHRYRYFQSDIQRVIHLIDTDGAFIPDTNVIASNNKGLQYENDLIVCGNVNQVIDRNKRKKSVLLKLYQTKEISKIPYGVYYFSRNLEHVLHNISGNLTDVKKIDYADQFADEYEAYPNKFVEFLSNSPFRVPGDYGDTWRFIFDGTHSLNRYCNVHLLF